MKQQFTNRITHANAVELLVILYDMFDEYAKEAKSGYADGKKGDDASKDAQPTIADNAGVDAELTALTRDTALQ